MLNANNILKRKHELSDGASSLDEDDESPKLHKTTLSEFGNKEVLLKSIDTQLVEIISQEMTNIYIMDGLLLLMNSIYKCISYDNRFEGSRIYLFGSRLSGLALKDSDVDLYFCIAGTYFGGTLSNDHNSQKELVCYFRQIFSYQNNEYKNIRPITRAQVPIVKFVHVPTGLNCDLSFKSGLSTHITKLVRLYLSLNERIHWVVCAVKRWALQNNMKNRSMFSSFALTWLVLYYLMAIEVVPPLKLLREHADYSRNAMFIEDWDCTFCTLVKAKTIWEVPTISCWDLLFGFFKFYSDSADLQRFVFCPAIGKAIPKEDFHQLPILNPDILDFNKKKNGDPIGWSKILKYKFCGENLALEDPFNLFNNLTRSIVPIKLQTFSHLCNKTMEVMNKEVQ